MIPYFPAEGGGFRLSLGLKVLDPADWIEIDAHYADDLAKKRHLLSEQSDAVFQALPGSEAAQQVLWDILSAHLIKHHGHQFRRQDDGLHNTTTGGIVSPDAAAPLKATAGLVQEDILLLQPGPDGHRLVAAILCFPTRWRLAEKMGKPLAAIHGPVPGYADRLERQMDRLFGGLTEDRILWRQNFSLMDDPALFQPGGHFKDGAGAALTVETIGDDLWFRVERQTLRLLPDSDVTCFTVRIHQARLREVVHTPERARDLISVIDAMPPGMKRYKSLPGFEAPLRAWLTART